MDTNASSTSSGSSTFFTFARDQKARGASAETVRSALIDQGMDPGRAGELVASLYSAQQRKAAVASVGAAVGSGTVNLARPLLAGFGAAVACALFWAVLAVVTHRFFFYAAWGVGAAVGGAVYAAAPEEDHGKAHLMLIAFCGAVFGIFLGLYFAIGLALEGSGLEITSTQWFSIEGIAFYFGHLDTITSPVLLVFIILAVISALKLSGQD